MSASNESTNSASNTCVVCYKNVEVYSIGLCEHPVCYECSTRMRVLCRQNECPICRQELPKVVFTRETKSFRHLSKNNLVDKQYEIHFDTPEIQSKFYDLLAHSCNMCREKPVFNNFTGLKQHMRQVHELHYCDLCVQNLKIFSHERRCYSRANLALHRRKGDMDDKSHKGHPLCEFCDERYMDNDELYRHLRRDHLFCHFCDADGLHQYYSSYDYLREHFRHEHYTCEEGLCVEEKFTSVFRTDIDLKAHKTSVHGKQLSKAAAKQARTLELEFTLAPRPENRMNRRPMVGPSTARGSREYPAGRDYSSREHHTREQSGRDYSTKEQSGRDYSSGEHSGRDYNPREHSGRDYNSREHNGRDYNSREHSGRDYNSREHSGRDYNSREHSSRDFNVREHEQPPVSSSSNIFVGNTVNQPSVDVQSTEEFPSLGNATPVVPALGQSKGRGNVTIRSTLRGQPLAVTDENFPALGPESSSTATSKTVNFSLSSANAAPSSISQGQKGATSNLSIRVNHEPNGTVTTRVSGPNLRIRPAQLSIDSEFPALGCPEPTTSSTNSGQWKEVVQWTCSKSAPTSVPKPKKVASPPLIPSPPTIRSGDDFPTLSKSSKSKKQYTITVMPSWGQAQASSSSSASNSNSNNTKTTGDMTKGKTKKKKSKQNGNASESETWKTNISTLAVKKSGEPAKNPTTNGSAAQPSLRAYQTVNNIDNSENTSKSSNVPTTKEFEQVGKKEKKKSKGAENTCTTIVNKQVESNSTNGTQRKRTELKIDSLNSTNNSSRSERLADDFPALNSSSSSKPPGLPNPPPGFGATTPPPPGFCIKYLNDKMHNNNGLTFTTSSGESYSILPDNSGDQSKSYSYVAPPDFQKRNKSLVAKVNEVLVDQDHIDEFRYVSGLFRQGTLDAQDYYSHCHSVMGISALGSVFPELLVLLPDISKQQELFKVYKEEIGSKIKSLESCATCGQVLKGGSDFRSHMTSHTLENHFPALGKSNAPPVKNSWARK